MKIKIRFFALFKDLVGKESLDYEVKEGTKIEGLKQALQQAFPRLREYPTIIAIGSEYKEPDYILKEGDEVNILPPFSGGSFIKLTEQPLQVEELIEQVRKPEFGAVVLFLGTIRGSSGGRKVLYLEYEAHPQLAQKELERIVEEAKARWAVEAALSHRLGKVNVSEVALAIAVASAHRKEALEACSYLIERLKQTVPIWKREVFEEGEAWVGERK